MIVTDGVVLFFFFFFKQKTAYEMRISDWSSDVCSSDLGKRRASGQEASVLLDCATHCQSRPSLPTFSGVLGRRENSPDQTRIAPVEPYRPVISFWSLPTQTTARWSPV